LPLVSVVMPVYNSAFTLGASIRSVLTQTHSDLELLVTDDASSDDSMDLLTEFARQDERVLPESAPGRGGAGPGTQPRYRTSSGRLRRLS
jgi:teichuronic acid biosynthesis glycosyltransferase TuaG